MKKVKDFVEKNKIAVICALLVVIVILVSIIAIMMINIEDNEKGEDIFDSKERDESDNLKFNDLDYIDFTKVVGLDSYDVDIEETEEEGEFVQAGYDGYYIFKKDDRYYLYRHKNQVADITELGEEGNIYRDETDNNSLYIHVERSGDYYYFAQVRSGDYAINVLGERSSYVSVLYNVKNGVVHKYDGYLSLIFNYYGQEEVNYYLLTKFNENGDVHFLLVNGTTFEVVTDGSKFDLVGDAPLLGLGDDLCSFSKKYIVVTKIINGKTKYGLIDYEGNIVIDMKYDDLVFAVSSTTNSQNDSTILLAKKDGKYGAIDTKDNVIVPIKYDGIDYANDMYAVSLSSKIGVLDANGNEIVPISIDFNDVSYYKFYEFRPCCATLNSFWISSYGKNGDALVVTYFAVGEKDPTDESGYKRKYLVLDSTYKYKIVDDYDFG